ncbi:MAG: type II secretion system F family protein, partial [Candidatus Dadabacteria bacterium]|nr:type II secretion system F family protein [Candidatus Dadabacteria bacterium]
MPVFVWEGRFGGTIKKGEMDAPSRSAVLARLRQMQIQPIPNRIKEKGKLFGLNITFGSISTRDLVIFTRQLSTMIDAGLPLVRGLDIIASQHPNLKFKQIIVRVKEDVEAGSTFADSLAKHPKVFNNLYTQLIKAGETGGVLDVILQRLASYLEKMDSIKRKIKGAMVYPSIVISVAIMVLAIVIIFVVPVFAEMFKDMGTTLPALTQLVVDISFFTRHNILYILIAIAAIFFLIGFSYSKSYKV